MCCVIVCENFLVFVQPVLCCVFCTKCLSVPGHAADAHFVHNPPLLLVTAASSATSTWQLTSSCFFYWLPGSSKVHSLITGRLSRTIYLPLVTAGALFLHVCLCPLDAPRLTNQQRADLSLTSATLTRPLTSSPILVSPAQLLCPVKLNLLNLSCGVTGSKAFSQTQFRWGEIKALV